MIISWNIFSGIACIHMYMYSIKFKKHGSGSLIVACVAHKSPRIGVDCPWEYALSRHEIQSQSLSAGGHTWSGRFTQLQETHLDSPSKMKMCLRMPKRYGWKIGKQGKSCHCDNWSPRHLIPQCYLLGTTLAGNVDLGCLRSKLGE